MNKTPEKELRQRDMGKSRGDIKGQWRILLSSILGGKRQEKEKHIHRNIHKRKKGTME